jgi:hypothetical protein
MFSIHNFREGWELMPTALSLKVVMEATGEEENPALSQLTGLSEPQIERCKLLIDLPERFQKLSLDPNPKTRIPSNFWIECAPVLEFAVPQIDSLRALGKNRATDKLVEKYRAKKIKSVIHFRRVMDAYEISEDDPALRKKVLRSTEQYFLNTNLETRQVFDVFVVDHRRTKSALSQCEDFIASMNRLKLRYIADDDDRKELMTALRKVRVLCNTLESSLKGQDDPTVDND